MMERRIERWYDGTLRPTLLDPPRLSSARAPWSGFLLEGEPCIGGSANRIVIPHAELIMMIGGGAWIETRAFGVSQKFFAGPDTVTLWPAGHDLQSASWKPVDSRDGDLRITCMQLDPLALDLLKLETEGRSLPMLPALDDPVLASLMRLAEGDIKTGCATGRLYGESLCLALGTHVLGRYATGFKEKRPGRAGLSAQQRERVRELVQANLDGDLSLAELARVAGLSPQHFTVACRGTFGKTPHQYILGERINRARRLLANQRLSLADVAFSVGFATQSHFTAAFRKAVGVTPRDYRAAL